MPRLNIFAVAACLLIAGTSPALAGVFQWNAPGGGSFGNPANWLGPGALPGVPGGGDEAHFNIAAAYPVTFSGDHDNQILFVFDDNVDFDLGGHTYTLWGVGDALLVVPGFSGRLGIDNGSVVAMNGRVLVDDPVGGGTLLEVFAAGELSILDGHDLFIGEAGSASVRSDGTIKVTGTTAVTPGSLLSLDAGSFSTGAIDVGGDPTRVQWNGGGFHLTDSGLNVGATGALGPSLFLFDTTMPLGVSGTTTIDPGSDVTIAGGVFSTGALDYADDPARFMWLDGTLNLTDSDLLVGLGGLLNPLGFDTVGLDMKLGVSGTTTVASDMILFVDGGAMTAGLSTSHGPANTLQLDTAGTMVAEGGVVVGTTTLLPNPGVVQIEADGAVNFSGGLLVADEIDLPPGGVITATDPAPETKVESTLRVNDLLGFGPGVTMPAFLNLQLGHSTGGSSVHVSAAPLTLSGGEATLTVGYDADATVTVDSGATASTPILIIGDQPTGDGTVNIAGPGTTWTAAQGLFMGGEREGDNNGGQGELNIAADAQLTSYGGNIGMEAGSQATVNVSGDARWTSDIGLPSEIVNWLSVGVRGSGTVNIFDGGVVSAWVTQIGSDIVWGDPTADGTVNVDGLGSQLLSPGLRVGGLGSGELNLTNDATANVASGIVTTALGVLERGSILVASGSTLTSADAGMVNDDFAESGIDPIITVRDPGSTWINLGPLDIAYNQILPDATLGADLVIESQGSVTSGRVSVGLTPNQHGRVRVDGPGSELNVTEVLVIGGDGDPFSPALAAGTGTLTVSDGGHVSSTSASVLPAGVAIGLRDLAVGTATVRGIGSRLQSDSAIWVGALGGNGLLSISDGAVVENVGANIGSTAGTLGDSQGAVLVDAATWDNGGGSVEVGGTGGTGALQLANGGQVDALIVRIKSGSQLLGNGQINADLVISGSAARRSTGTLSVDGELAFGASGLLEIEIDGLISNAEFDQVTVTGNVAFDGTLDVVIDPMFVPQLGDSFSIITYGSYSGEFETITGLDFDGQWLTPLYEANQLRLAVLATGDANGDGKVDGLDYLIWAGNYGDTDPPETLNGAADGDFNHDDTIDGLDYLAWADNYGKGPNDATAVPEPAPLMLFALGVAVVVTNRRRDRKR